MQLMIPVAVGELFDKISILEIKSERISNKEKLEHINSELHLLQEIVRENNVNLPAELYAEIKSVNERLWDTEDLIREKEEHESFDDEFVRLARADAIFNDKRFLVKKRINEFCGSVVVEQKSYKDSILEKHQNFDG
jgi:hypothetical protein